MSNAVWDQIQPTSQDPQQQAIAALGSQVAPQLGADTLQYQIDQSQFGQVTPDVNLQNAYAQSMAGFQGQQLGISGQQLGLQQSNLGLQRGLSQQQQGIEQQQYNLQQGVYPEQQAAQKTAYAQAMLGESGNIATSGAQGTVGAKSQLGAIQQQNTFAQADIARNQQLSQLGQKSELAGYNEQQAQYGNAASNLALMAQANGISQAQLLEQLNYGINQNNLQGQQTAQGLLGQMGSLAAGDITTAGTAIGNVAYAANVNPYAPPGS